MLILCLFINNPRFFHSSFRKFIWRFPGVLAIQHNQETTSFLNQKRGRIKFCKDDYNNGQFLVTENDDFCLSQMAMMMLGGELIYYQPQPRKKKMNFYVIFHVKKKFFLCVRSKELQLTFRKHFKQHSVQRTCGNLSKLVQTCRNLFKLHW